MKIDRLILFISVLAIAGLLISGCKSTKKVTSAPDTEPKEEVREKPEVGEEEAVVEKTPREKSVEEKLNGNFDEIANSTSINLANRSISEALSYFESTEVPVFIVFYRHDGQKDYDKPTTILKHLNYLKDQKKNPYMIDKVVYNDAGKIEEIELTTR